jgi:hypothetical protein
MSTDTPDTAALLDLLARWQAFSELQQRAFAFLAAEAVHTGQEFENSTDGAARVLTRMGQPTEADEQELMAETFQVVSRLQAADRSRQGLEQVASVLTMLRRQHEELTQHTANIARIAQPDELTESWIDALAGEVSLADWRRRLVDALNGGDIVVGAQPQPEDDDDELF